MKTQLMTRLMASVFIAGAVVAADTPSARAQFLEKLEAAVRAQLENNERPQSDSTDELPPPGSGTAPAEPDAVAPRGTAGSGLELPAQETPPPVPAPIPAGERRSGGSAAEMPPVERIYLGLEAEDATGGGIGVRVTSITQGSPAWKGGFELGDRILAVDGFAIASLDAMADRLSQVRPGEAVRFLIKRGNRNLELVSVPTSRGIAPNRGPDATASAWLGLVVNDLTPAMRQQLGVGIFRGAAVTSVVPNSPAAQAGIEAGDVIAEVNGRRIEKAEELLATVATARPGGVLELMVARGITARPVFVTLDSRDNSPSAERNANRVVTPAPSLSNPRPAEAPLTDSPSERETQLRQEIERLQIELDIANQRLDDTEQRLNTILESLKR